MSFFFTSLFEKIKIEGCLDTVSILFVHGRAILTMEGKSVLPLHISPFGVNKEVQLKAPKQGLYKVCIDIYTL
jgi:hypothetical protein